MLLLLLLLLLLMMLDLRRALTQMKLRLKGAQKGHSLLKKKADALTMRFRALVRKIVEVLLPFHSLFQPRRQLCYPPPLFSNCGPVPLYSLLMLKCVLPSVYAALLVCISKHARVMC